MSSAKGGVYRGWSPDARKITTPDPSHERRGTHRIDIDTDASFVSEGYAMPTRGRTVNLSTSGALLVLDRLHGVGNILKLTIKMPTESEVTGTAIVRTSLRGRGNGVEFLMLPEEARHAIERLTERPFSGYQAKLYEEW